MEKKEEISPQIDRYIEFIKGVEGLKSVERTAWTASGRRESTAEHSWRLALLVGVLVPEFPEADPVRALMMSLIHDIGEIEEGDVSTALGPDPEEKYGREQAAARTAFSRLPKEQGERLMELWEEYEEGRTPEARMVKALDKAETIIQHNQGKNPDCFDYEFNLAYGAAYFEKDEILRLAREILDRDTREKMEGRA